MYALNLIIREHSTYAIIITVLDHRVSPDKRVLTGVKLRLLRLIQYISSALYFTRDSRERYKTRPRGNMENDSKRKRRETEEGKEGRKEEERKREGKRRRKKKKSEQRDKYGARGKEKEGVPDKRDWDNEDPSIGLSPFRLSMLLDLTRAARSPTPPHRWASSTS